MPAPSPTAPPLAITPWPLPYASALETRAPASIDLVVIHCTELPDLAMAREFGERALYAAGTGNSGHYYVDVDGGVFEFVPPAHVAHHTRGYNPRSIGIELVNIGRYPDWLDSRRQVMQQAYPDAQIAALIALLRGLEQQLPSLRLIAGHEDLDTDQQPASDNPAVLVFRKRDPGPLFPWPRVLQGCTLTRLAAP